MDGVGCAGWGGQRSFSGAKALTSSRARMSVASMSGTPPSSFSGSASGISGAAEDDRVGVSGKAAGFIQKIGAGALCDRIPGLDAVLAVADGLLYPGAAVRGGMQGPQTGAFEAVLIEPGFQRRQRAQDADTRAFPAALPHMADHGVDHVHEAHGPPGRVELFEGRVQYPRAVGSVAGHTDDGRSGPRQFRHDVP